MASSGGGGIGQGPEQQQQQQQQQQLRYQRLRQSVQLQIQRQAVDRWVEGQRRLQRSEGVDWRELEAAAEWWLLAHAFAAWAVRVAIGA